MIEITKSFNGTAYQRYVFSLNSLILKADKADLQIVNVNNMEVVTRFRFSNSQDALSVLRLVFERSKNDIGVNLNVNESGVIESYD